VNLEARPEGLLFSRTFKIVFKNTDVISKSSKKENIKDNLPFYTIIDKFSTSG